MTRSSGPTMRLAMLGCGKAARMHQKTLRKLGLPVEISYASRNAANAAEYRERHGGVASFGSYEQAITSDQVDVVAVLSPPASHLELTLAAMKAGKDVIVEKPAFMRARDFDQVEKEQQRSGRRVFVAENYLYKPLTARLRQVIRNGLIGDVLFVHINAIKEQTTADWRDDAALAGPGALFEGGVHWINLASNIGLTVDAARGLRPGDPTGIERSMLVTLSYREGAVGTLAYSWEVPSALKGLRISKVYGRKGSITFESNGLFMMVHGRHRRLCLPGFRDIAGYRAMFCDFVDAWQRDRESAMTLAMARRDLELIESCYETAGAAGRTAA